MQHFLKAVQNISAPRCGTCWSTTLRKYS